MANRLRKGRDFFIGAGVAVHGTPRHGIRVNVHAFTRNGGSSQMLLTGDDDNYDEAFQYIIYRNYGQDSTRALINHIVLAEVDIGQPITVQLFRLINGGPMQMFYSAVIPSAILSYLLGSGHNEPLTYDFSFPCRVRLSQPHSNNTTEFDLELADLRSPSDTKFRCTRHIQPQQARY